MPVSIKKEGVNTATVATRAPKNPYIRYPTKVAVTDVFRRFLVMSVLEKISESFIQEDNKRLKEFLISKKAKGEIISLKVKKACCESGTLSKEVRHG
ncbi:MAG: hypothetical protein AB1638_02105 [Nitrospirota bacterium]